MQFESPKSEAIVCVNLFKEFIQECEKEIVIKIQYIFDLF